MYIPIAFRRWMSVAAARTPIDASQTSFPEMPRVISSFTESTVVGGGVGAGDFVGSGVGLTVGSGVGALVTIGVTA
jgi:hypothetical protein